MKSVVRNIVFPKPDAVMYHGNCADGNASAWIAKLYAGKKLETYTYRYEKDTLPLPSVFTNKNVLVLDISLPLDYCLQIKKVAKSFYIFDHHEPTIEQLKGQDFLIFDEKRAASQITWDCLFPDKPRPPFIDYIAERDLWLWSSEDSKPINTAMHELRYSVSFSGMDRIYEDWSDEKRTELRDIGVLLENIKTKKHELIYSKAVDALLKPIGSNETFRVKLVCCPAKDRSDVGNFLAQDQNCQFAAMWRYNFPKDEWYISLRGRDSCNINLSQLTEKYFLQGGGHALAAGFMIDGKLGQNLSTYFHLIEQQVPIVKYPKLLSSSSTNNVPEKIKEIVETIESRERENIIRQAVLSKMHKDGKSQFVKLTPKPLSSITEIVSALFNTDDAYCNYVGFWEYNFKTDLWTVILYRRDFKKEEFSFLGKSGDKLSTYFEAIENT